MPKKKRGRPQGHYCKVCGEYKANEKFSGKGHAAHICKDCSQLSSAEQAEAMTINRLMNFPMSYVAVRMTDYHDFADAQFKYCDQLAPNHTAKSPSP